MAGFAQGGGVGLALAQWIIDGEPEGDIFAMDVARFGPYATRNLHRREGARVLRTPLPDRLSQRVLARRPALEDFRYSLRPQGGQRRLRRELRAGDVPAISPCQANRPWRLPTLRRSNAFQAVREECHAARHTARHSGYFLFLRNTSHGPLGRRGAGPAAGRPSAADRTHSPHPHAGPLGSPDGRSDHAAPGAEDRFQIGGSGYLQSWHMRWFAEHLARRACKVRNVLR